MNLLGKGEKMNDERTLSAIAEPMDSGPVYLVNGKPHRPCKCDRHSEVCAQAPGYKRKLLTTEFAHCVLPVNDVLLLGQSAASQSRPMDDLPMGDPHPCDMTTDELDRHLAGEHHAIQAQSIDSPMNACSLKETCLWLKGLAAHGGMHDTPLSSIADTKAEVLARKLIEWAETPHPLEETDDELAKQLRVIRDNTVLVCRALLARSATRPIIPGGECPTCFQKVPR